MHCDMTRAEMEAEGRRSVRESRALRGEVAGMIRLSQELVAQSRNTAQNVRDIYAVERETKLTGLPRFDALLEAGAAVPPDRRDLILVAPTWRNWLTETRPGGARSTVSAAELAASDFGVNWLGLIRSQELKTLADELGLKVALLLHPDLQAVSYELDLPDHVEVMRFAGQDVRMAFARARVPGSLVLVDTATHRTSAALLVR